MKYSVYIKFFLLIGILFFCLSIPSGVNLEIQSVKALDSSAKSTSLIGGAALLQLGSGSSGSNSQSTVPYQFGGQVIYYQPACTVTNITGTCEAVCPMCTSMLGPACTGYQEIQFSPVTGSMPPNFICVPKGFPFKQSTPAPGGKILGGGASNIALWMVAASQ